SISYTVVPVTINSKAQHAIPNVIGNMDDKRAQLIRSSNAATMTPPSSNFLSSNPFIYATYRVQLSVSVIHFPGNGRLVLSRLRLRLNPIEITFCPCPDQSQCENENEEDHLHK